MNTVPDLTGDEYERLLDSRREADTPGVRQQRHWHVDAYYAYDKPLEPTANHILIELALEDEVMEGGLIIPDMHRDIQAVGLVIAKGPGKVDKKGRRHSLAVEVGDKVAFKLERGMSVEIAGKPCRLIKDDFVLGKVV
jgi:chaperonin GroES